MKVDAQKYSDALMRTAPQPLTTGSVQTLLEFMLWQYTLIHNLAIRKLFDTNELVAARAQLASSDAQAAIGTIEIHRQFLQDSPSLLESVVQSIFVDQNPGVESPVTTLNKLDPVYSFSIDLAQDTLIETPANNVRMNPDADPGTVNWLATLKIEPIREVPGGPEEPREHPATPKTTTWNSWNWATLAIVAATLVTAVQMQKKK